MEHRLDTFGRTLVIAPHPDDEVLGAGGTMARLAAEGNDVFVAIVTQALPPAFPAGTVARAKAEAGEAHRLLGVRETFWLGFPAAGIAETAHSALNAALLELVQKLRPQTLLVPFIGDMHIDHQLIFLSSLVSARPHQAEYPRLVLAYETVSETNWNAPYVTPSFVPNVYVDVADHLETKLSAMKAYASQVREAPHERSIETLKALATLRGATVMRRAAEAFVLIRQVM
ncbi:PIG-L deacetylase family protein [Sinorhizobium sp. BG8]|uniref:PIG-L deacetylase family protein n=1 Tax=Sinorhizobium sp. BG8 TaxID=2613773 RepID=UPI00193C93A2|nr:PIG-L deacetylase family protein [Sinorhizobium sp. BG8]QRM56440.1 PIG-L family deacetylase [Sinorhizobium sp. BG8]